MYIRVCDICRRPIQEGNPDGTGVCQRCGPFYEKYLTGLAELMQQIQEDGRKRLNRYREQFLQNEIVKKQDALRAVK